jgi:hypothetical protein
MILLAIPVNAVLYGCESWSLKKELMDEISTFYHRAARRLLLPRRLSGSWIGTPRKKCIDMTARPTYADTLNAVLGPQHVDQHGRFADWVPVAKNEVKGSGEAERQTMARTTDKQQHQG